MAPPTLRILIGIVLTFASSLLAVGQSSPGKITGTVKDADGAILSGVNVSLQLPTQAVPRATVTDAQGKFTLDNIEGPYQVRELLMPLISEARQKKLMERQSQYLHVNPGMQVAAGTYNPFIYFRF